MDYCTKMMTGIWNDLVHRQLLNMDALGIIFFGIALAAAIVIVPVFAKGLEGTPEDIVK